MKGILFSLVVFLIFMGIAAYANMLVTVNTKNQELVTEALSAQRIYHAWKAVDSGMQNLVNVSTAKKDFVLEVNDSLPAERDVKTLLDRYGLFIEQLFKDNTIDVRFEDSSGNKVELENMESKITIKPMNVTYEWDSWGKNEMEIRSLTANLGFVQSINLSVRFVNNTIANDSIMWTPYKDCRPNYPCLNFFLTVSDGTKTLVSEKTTFDLSRGSKTEVIYCGAGDCWMRVRVGLWVTEDPQNIIKIELHNLNITTNTRIKMNTTEFFINYPAMLAVRTAFAEKVEFL